MASGVMKVIAMGHDTPSSDGHLATFRASNLKIGLVLQRMIADR